MAINILTKKVLAIIIFLLIFFCFNIEPAYAEFNCFAPETLISTPQGKVKIEELHQKQIVINYDIEQKTKKTDTVKDIIPKSSLGYFLVNNNLKLSGTSLVYLKNWAKPKIIRVQDLKPHHNISQENNLDLQVNNIEQKIEPIECFVITFEQKANFYADETLFYSDNQVPAKFKLQDPIGCRYGHCLYWSLATVRGMLISFAALVAGILLAANFLDWIRRLKS